MIVALLSAVAFTADSSAIQRLDARVREYLEATWRRHPESATAVGIHRYDRLSSDLSLRAAAVERRAVAAALDALRRDVDTATLDEGSRIDFLLFHAALATAVRSAEISEPLRRIPGAYIPFGGVYQLIEDGGPARGQLLAAATARLRTWPMAFALARRQLDRPPRLWTELALGSAQGIARYLRTRVAAAADSAPPRVGAPLRGAAARAADALDAFRRWMQDTLLIRSEGSWEIGAPHYDWLLANSKLLPFTANALIDLGREVMRETEDSLAALGRRIDSTRSWQQLADSSKTLHPPRDSVRAAYARETARARDFIERRGLFALPADERLEMIDTPPNLRATYAYGGYDAPAPFASERVGRFFVTPVDSELSSGDAESKLRGHNYGWITVVAVHEGYPGHHLQTVKALENPRLVRRLFGSEVFGEGWGLYAEELMYRSGFYRDSLARLTQLRMRLWRAARVVIDPSLHTGRMSLEDAVQFFVDRVGLERRDAWAEVARYTTWPTQAISYIVGMRELERLREDVRSALGSGFDERAFHEAVLAEGSLPPILMRRAVATRLGLAPRRLSP
ncbi:MAG: DUF885 domain-containing protein [Gemmatimonadetes bacterium]|nr:DUF885 domain-containing protein [Gemmatimonadota bacterium]